MRYIWAVTGCSWLFFAGGARIVLGMFKQFGAFARIKVGRLTRALSQAWGFSSLQMLFAFLTASLVVDLISDSLDDLGVPFFRLVFVLMIAGLWFAAYRSHFAKAREVGAVCSSLELSGKRGAVLTVGLDSTDSANGYWGLLDLGRFADLQYLVLIGSPQTAAAKVCDYLVNHVFPAAGVSLSPEQVLVLEDGPAGRLAHAKVNAEVGLRWLFGHGLAPSEVVAVVSHNKFGTRFQVASTASVFGVESMYYTDEFESGRWSFKILEDFGAPAAADPSIGSASAFEVPVR